MNDKRKRRRAERKEKAEKNHCHFSTYVQIIVLSICLICRPVHKNRYKKGGKSHQDIDETVINIQNGNVNVLIGKQ